MKKLLLIIIFFIFSTLLFFPAVFSEEKKEVKFRVGVSLPLSGGVSFMGNDLKNALLFAKEYFKAKNIELIFEDDKCEGKFAVSAAHKFINIDKVDLVTGVACSGSILAAAPVYEGKKVPVFVVLASSRRITQGRKYIYQLSPNDGIAAVFLAKKILKDGHKKVGIISEQTEYCEDFNTSITEALKGKAAYKIESFAPGSVDIRAELLRLKQFSPTAVFVNAQAELSEALVVKQMHQLHFEPTIYAAYYPSSAVFLKAVGKLADNIIYVDTPTAEESLTNEGKKLFRAFVKKYGKPKTLDYAWALGFEGFRVVYEGLKALKSRRVSSKNWADNFRAWLLNKRFQGVFGEYKFNSKGVRVPQNFALRVIKKGKPVSIREHQ
ncbi:MAG: ABC transporter substrate-binding protein [Candidatus Dadabacteria bacterium]|nr:MAG: ABC transporter substrate-binding protein [Candidatus Dadabacteria bacterium]